MLPFTAGATVDAALTGRDPLARWVVGVGAWVLWAAGTATLGVARTSTLTVARFVVPGGLAATVAAAVVAAGGDTDVEYLVPATALGITAAAVATASGSGLSGLCVINVVDGRVGGPAMCKMACEGRGKRGGDQETHAQPIKCPRGAPPASV